MNNKLKVRRANAACIALSKNSFWIVGGTDEGRSPSDKLSCSEIVKIHQPQSNGSMSIVTSFGKNLALKM